MPAISTICVKSLVIATVPSLSGNVIALSAVLEIMKSVAYVSFPAVAPEWARNLKPLLAVPDGIDTKRL